MNDAMWFGYISQLQALKFVCEEGLGITIKPVRFAPEGLEALTKEDPQLILFNTPTPVGNLKLPDAISLHDWVSTDCYVIRCIREIKPRTPLVVNHVSVFPGCSIEHAQVLYGRAGATELIDWGIKNEEFISALRKYLK